MELKDSPGVIAGDLCFKGPCTDGAVEIGYGLREGFCGKGYMTEAVKTVTRWALTRPGVTRVEAETDPGNAASQRVLSACGFVPTGETGEEGPRFVLTAEGV
jgi:RimJ/RimL family protein N-acetyltransferase